VTSCQEKIKEEKIKEEIPGEPGQVKIGAPRLVPIFPFNLLNYGFGLIGIPFRT